VDALDMKTLRNEKKTVSIWRTDVMSRGTSGDLRSVIPVMVAAATPNFGKNTKKQIVINISDADKRVQQIKAETNPNQK
jgi:hypothetical protein